MCVARRFSGREVKSQKAGLFVFLCSYSVFLQISICMLFKNFYKVEITLSNTLSENRNVFIRIVKVATMIFSYCRITITTLIIVGRRDAGGKRIN